MPETMEQLQVLSIKEISKLIKQILEGNFSSVEVRGEIISPKRHTSGHLYFTLKDGLDSIDCIAWKNAKLSFEPTEGMEVVCKARLTTYSAKSKYQLIVSELSHSGIGSLMKMIDDRRKKLASEGLFDKKTPIPQYPNTIGIVTSETGSVIHDMLHRLRDRYPSQVIFYPISVQGDTTHIEAIKAINYLEAKVDVIIIARGGGSFEDLVGFSDESLARRIFACTTPVVSAIGHETDFTICDYVADLRAPTPTAAIELITPDRYSLIESIRSNLQYGHESLNMKIIQSLDLLNKMTLPGLQTVILNRVQRLDYINEDLKYTIVRSIDNIQAKLTSIQKPNLKFYWDRFIQSKIALDKEISFILSEVSLRLERSITSLKALSYKSTLKRGFCRAYNKRTIQSVHEAEKNFVIEFKDGSVEVQRLK